VSAVSPARPAPEARLARFDRVERIVHWVTAVLMLTLLVTGFSLYTGPLSKWIGRRHLMRTLHVYSGLLLPIPVLLAISLHAGRELRADLGRLNRWTRDDRAWWSRRRRSAVRLGKFNPGQKLNATFIGAAIVVMLMTGSIMHWFEPFSDSWRQGATFVHDWFAIGLFFAIAGHILLAIRDPDALNGMVRGWVKPSWAHARRPRWYETETDRLSEGRADGAMGNAAAGAAEHGGEAGPGARQVTVVDRVDGRAADGIGDGEL
jgi:formate dehydrogenase subunit gamma